MKFHVFCVQISASSQTLEHVCATLGQIDNACAVRSLIGCAVIDSNGSGNFCVKCKRVIV